ncbi:MAG: hypothetical protein KQH53_05695 [Desulfarculaceae bacterium]|nr:hypothetical protein [Desulfarculaceae bacterium]
MAAKPKIVFLIRAYNDIDHITPLVYKLAADGSAQCRVFCSNPTFDLDGDFRIEFLRRQMKVPVSYLYQAHRPTPLHLAMDQIICGTKAGRGSLWRSQAAVAWLQERARHRLYSQAWCRGFLQKERPDVLVVDWQRPKFFNTLYLLRAARELGIPMVSVPHGMNLATTTLCTTKDLENGHDQDYGHDWRFFDYNLVQFEFFRQRVINGGLPPEKVVVLGSARFCPQWREVYKRILPPDRDLAGRGADKLRVVYMDHHHRMRMQTEQVNQMIAMMLARPEIELLVKPSTRAVGQALSDPAWAASSEYVRNLDCLATDHQSLNLILWSQVTINAASSICLEALWEGQAFVYPKYLHENDMLFEDFGACWQVNDHQELADAMARLAAEPDYRPYTREAARAFLAEAAQGGDPERDVLQAYADFMLSLA